MSAPALLLACCLLLAYAGAQNDSHSGTDGYDDEFGEPSIDEGLALSSGKQNVTENMTTTAMPTSRKLTTPYTPPPTTWIPESQLTLLPKDCGSSTPGSILGGEEAQLREFPWLALLMYEDVKKTKHFWCAGSLINSRYVVTAAHCIRHIGKHNKLVSVRLGEHDLTKDVDCKGPKDCAPRPVDIGLEEQIVHPQWAARRTRFNDIALLRLNQDISYTSEIKPICLPIGALASMSHVGKRLIFSGWGHTERGQQSSVKLKTDVPVMSTGMCANLYGSYSVEKRGGMQMCAGGEKGKGACLGDGGDPLMSLEQRPGDKMRFHLVGLVSFGPIHCRKPNQPDVYTRVGHYLPWILNNLRP